MESNPSKIGNNKENNNKTKDEIKTESHQTPQQFDHNKIKLDSCIGIMGKRRYGKTIWLEFVLSKMWQNFPAGGFVFTKTKHNQFWQNHFPETRIYEAFDHDVVLSILANQKAKLDRFIKTGHHDECPYVVVILDDMMSDKTLRYDELLNRFIFAGRHFFIFFAVCQQDVKGLGPSVRNNFDIIALTYQTQQRSMKSAQDDYADLFDNPDYICNLI